MEFNNLQTTRLGDRGEQFIQEFAKSKCAKAYIPAIKESYPCDSIAIHSGGTLFGIEAKCKPRMMYYEQTGFDANDFSSYCNLPFPIYILFIDHITKSIYGAWIATLKRFSLPKGNIVLFPLSCMTHYRYLTPEEVEYIKELNTSNYWN